MATALPWTQTCSRRRAAYEGCPDAPYYRTRGVTRGRRKGEDERGVENSTQTYCRSLKNRSLSLSVHFYIILPATLEAASPYPPSTGPSAFLRPAQPATAVQPRHR